MSNLARLVSLTLCSVVLLAVGSSSAIAAPPPEPVSLQLVSSTALNWSGSAGALAYNLYRGEISALPGGEYGACHDGNIEATSTSDAQIPSPGSAFFYVVSAMNEDGESALSRDSNGVEHPPSTRCIVARRLFRVFGNGVAADGVTDGQRRRRGEAAATAVTITSEGRDRLRVLATTGELEADSIDLEIAGRKQSYVMTRSYRSQADYDGPLGMNWDFGDNMRLVRSGSTVTLIDGQGLRETFVTGAGGFIAPPGLYGRLSTNADGSYTLRAKGIIKGNTSGGAVGNGYFDVSSDPLGVAINGSNSNIKNLRTRPAFFDVFSEPLGVAINGSNSNIKNLRSRLGFFDVFSEPLGVAINGSNSNIKNLRTRLGFFDVFSEPLGVAINGSNSNIKNPRSRPAFFDVFVDEAINHDADNDGIAIDEEGVQRLVLLDPDVDIDAAIAVNEEGINENVFEEQGIHRVLGRSRYHHWDWEDSLGNRRVHQPIRFDRAVGGVKGTFDTDMQPMTLVSFDARGRLTRVSDGTNYSSYLYDNHGLLRTVVDTLGRTISYEYNPDGRVQSVIDSSGRRVDYSYSGTGNGARLIEVQRSAGGGVAPSRTLYTYSTGNADPRLNNNLLSIVTAAQAAAGGTPTVQVGYGAPGTFQADRVGALTIGGTNASGIAAGGSFQYSYSSLNPGADPSLIDLPRRRCVMIDPVGNETQFDTNAAMNLLTVIERTNRNLRPGEPDYTTELRYNADGELVEIESATGNRLLMTYDRPGADRYREGNLLQIRSVADTLAGGGRGNGHGAESNDLVWSASYEPLYNQIASVTTPKGNDSSYVPPNGGAWSTERYTWRRSFDYQEGDPAINGVNALAAQHGVALGSFPLNLGDLNGDGTVDQIRGVHVFDKDPTIMLDAGSQQAAIEGGTMQPSETFYQYNDFGQLTRVVDGERNVHRAVYYSERDADGDGLPLADPPDGRVLSNTDGGLLHYFVLDSSADSLRNNKTDPPPQSIRHDFLYDALGRLVRHVNGRGVATRYVWSAADFVTEVVHAAATADASGPFGDPATGRGETGLTPFAYRTRFQFDRDGNLRKASFEDRDQSRGVGPFIEITMTHDILGGLRRITWPPTAGPFGLLSQFDTDANGQLIEAVGPAGDTLALEWDELGRLLSSTKGAGSSVSSKTGYDYYSNNARLSRVTDAIGNLTEYEYDGHNRLVRRVDAVGGRSERYLDPDSGAERVEAWGRCNGPSPVDRSGAGNVKLSDVKLRRDERGRLFRADRELYVPIGCPTIRPPEISEGGLTPGDNHVSTRFEHDRLGRLTFTTSDTLATHRYDYDGLSRIVAGKGIGDGDDVTAVYDAQFNPKEYVVTKRSSVPGPAPLQEITTYFYDALDRRVMNVSPTGLTHRFVWNSASDLGASSDAKGPITGSITRVSPGHESETVAINGHGNVTSYSYDSLGRLVSSSLVITATGEGDGTLSPPADTSNPYNSDGLVSMSLSYASSRLSAITDDNGNTTSYEYDARNRLVRKIEDDDTFASYAYDSAGRLASVTDANGSVATYAYDNLDRRIGAFYNRALLIGGTTEQLFEYDGLSRLTRATDNNDPTVSFDDSELSIVYDSLGRQLEEQQRLGSSGSPAITSRAWHGDNHTQATSPAGRQVEYQYDALDRMVTLRELTSGVDWDYRYFGSSQVHTIANNTGLTATALDDTGTIAEGIDGEGRVTRWRHLSGPFLVAGFEYGYDRAGRARFERRLHHLGGSGEYVGKRCEFDSAGRLTQYDESDIDFLGNLAATPTDSRTYQLDGEGNWNLLTRNGQRYLSTPNNLNEYDEHQSGGTRIDDGIPDDFLDLAGGIPDGWNLRHDKNGNETDIGPVSVQFDALGRAVRATRDSDGWIVGQYAYDGLGRRVRRETSQPGMAPEVTRYLYSGAEPIEERDGSAIVLREFVIAPRGGVLMQIGAGVAYHLLRDAAGNVVGAYEAGNSAPTERVVYDAHGKPTYQTGSNLPKLDAAGNPVAQSDLGVAEGLLGSRYDSEFSRRSKNANEDLGGLYSSGGLQGSNPLYDPNKARMLTRVIEADPGVPAQ
jgi:YD repeat-containing protein